jgi:hypothetical protein
LAIVIASNGSTGAALQRAPAVGASPRNIVRADRRDERDPAAARADAKLRVGDLH